MIKKLGKFCLKDENILNLDLDYDRGSGCYFVKSGAKIHGEDRIIKV